MENLLFSCCRIFILVVSVNIFMYKLPYKCGILYNKYVNQLKSELLKLKIQCFLCFLRVSINYSKMIPLESNDPVALTKTNVLIKQWYQPYHLVTTTFYFLNLWVALPISNSLQQSQTTSNSLPTTSQITDTKTLVL